MSYRWFIVSRPPQATASLSNASTESPTLSLGSERDIGTWRFLLEVDDDEGQMSSFPFQFTVPNVPPNFEINGPLEVVVNKAIGLGSSRTTDDDGGNLSFVWDILQTPVRSSQQPQNNYSTAYNISIPTTKADIGDWVFRLTATDNEGAQVSKTVTVKVVNAKPRIVFSGPAEIDVGQDLLVSTTILHDDDGGDLTFKWEVVQEPGSTGLPLPYAVSTTSLMSKPSLSTSGTWIFRLTATDDEGDSVQGEFKVLVDGLPWAYVESDGDDHSHPEEPLVVSQADYLLLYGWFNDPDSPCTDRPNRCHRTDGRSVSISQGIVRYQWNIIEIPGSVRNDMGHYALGPVHESFFGVADDGPNLDFGFLNIPVGLWGLELRVWDAEGNEANYPIYINVQWEPVPPHASFYSSLISSGERATTSLSGVLPVGVSFYAHQSYDPDNVNPGSGIIRYRWQAIPPTPGCSVPTFPEWQMEVVLYPVGTVVPPACQGRWRMRLTVDDDDRVTNSATYESSFSIGNCSGKVCLDTPRQIAPAVLSLAGTGGVLIGYHIDSALYDETVLGLGVYAKLDVFSEDDSLNPVYSSLSGPATQSSRGQSLLFYWNGLTQSGVRVQEGKYFHIKVSLLDSNSNILSSQSEYRAITSEPMRVVFNETTTKYVDYLTPDAVSFTLTGAQSPVDSYQGTLRDSAGKVVAIFSAPASATTMAIKYSVPGIYTLELSAIRGTSVIALGSHPVVFYELRITIPGMGSSSDWELLVNNDDDNLNELSDFDDAFIYGDDEVRQMFVDFSPSTLGGTLMLEHSLGAGALKAWTTLSKATEAPLPKTWNFPGRDTGWQEYGYPLYFEALKEAKGELRLRFTTTDGTSLPEVKLGLSSVLLEAVQDTDNDHIVEDEDTVLRSVRAGRWDNAFDSATFNVKNGMDPDHFVDLDPSRFYLRARGPGLDVDSSRIDTLPIDFNTSVQTVVYDSSSQMRIPESSVNSSTMVSRSLLLTGPDIESIPRTDTDDGFPAHDGISRVVADGWPGDRTWAAPIDGHLELYYNTARSAGILRWRLPVCGEARRKVPLRVHVFLEPFEDVGIDADGNPSTSDIVGDRNGRFDYADTNGNGQHDLGERSEPYVDLSDPMTDGLAHSGDDPVVHSARGPLTPINEVWRELRQTDSLWSPACIKTEVVGGTILVEDAPLSYSGTNILVDGVITESDIKALYQAYNESMTEDVIDVFYGTQMYYSGPASGLAFPPYYQAPALHGEKLFTIIQSNLPTYAILAHELAHLLTNTGDSAGVQTFFYPNNTGLDPLTTVSGGRRIPEWVAIEARSPRPSGDLNARGNRQLKAY